MLSSGKVHHEIGAKTDAVNCGGIGAVRRPVTKLGVVEEIDGNHLVVTRS